MKNNRFDDKIFADNWLVAQCEKFSGFLTHYNDAANTNFFLLQTGLKGCFAVEKCTMAISNIPQ
jgi:hypothetical protein